MRPTLLSPGHACFSLSEQALCKIYFLLLALRVRSLEKLPVKSLLLVRPELADSIFIERDSGGGWPLCILPGSGPFEGDPIRTLGGTLLRTVEINIPIQCSTLEQRNSLLEIQFIVK